MMGADQYSAPAHHREEEKSGRNGETPPCAPCVGAGTGTGGALMLLSVPDTRPNRLSLVLVPKVPTSGTCGRPSWSSAANQDAGVKLVWPVWTSCEYEAASPEG